MRVDPHDAQQLQGEIKAAVRMLQEARQAEHAAMVSLKVAIKRLNDYRQIDIEFWDDLAASVPDLVQLLESPAPLAVEEAAPPSLTASLSGGAALDFWNKENKEIVDGDGEPAIS